MSAVFYSAMTEYVTKVGAESYKDGLEKVEKC